MSTEARLMAVQLANQQLAAAHGRVTAALERIQAENQTLRRRIDRLERALAREEEARKAVEAAYRKRTGERYSGPLATTKFGFQNPG